MELEVRGAQVPWSLAWRAAPALLRACWLVLAVHMALVLAFAYLVWRIGHKPTLTLMVLLLGSVWLPLYLVGVFLLGCRLRSRWVISENGIRIRGWASERIRWLDVLAWGVRNLRYPGFKAVWVRAKRRTAEIRLGSASEAEDVQRLIAQFHAGA